MKLTDHFTLDEMIVTNSGLLNVPNADEIHYLKLLCERVLEPLRLKYGKPIHINSAFRSEAVNNHAGSKPTSQHRKGQAVDIDNGFEENKILFNLLSKMEKDQLIDEDNFGWVHVSFNPNANRNMLFKMMKGKTIK